MTNYRNPLRPKLKRAKPTLGLWITMAPASVTEIAVEMGLDWVCVDMEHGATAYSDVVNHARAAKGSDLAVLVRVPSIAEEPVKRCLDLGADGVVLPLVRSVQDVERALSYALYPPVGQRGLGGERAQRWGLKLQQHIATANDEIMVIPMIETAQAADAIEDILAVKGLEFLFIGPGDLSSSRGYIGQWEGPGVAEEIVRIARLAQARGVIMGTYGVSPVDIDARARQGFKFLAIGSDGAMLASRIKQTLGEIANVQGRAAP